MISTSRTSPPSTSMRPTPGTLASAGRTTNSRELAQLARVDRARDVERDDRERAGRHALDDDLRRPGGSDDRSSATRDSTICSARHMSVSGANWSEISVAPRMVFERMRWTPRTVVSACSSGRVTVVRKTSAGEPPARATTTIARELDLRVDAARHREAPTRRRARRARPSPSQTTAAWRRRSA